MSEKKQQNPIHLADEISRAVRAEGGRAFAAGGYVRDVLMHIPSKDIDLEVYGLTPDRLQKVLSRFGRVNLVGQAFGVLKLGSIDISLPRRENKIGLGHKGFEVLSDPFLSFKEACRRRDLTINAILLDLLTREIIDPFNGQADLCNKIIRATDPTTFGEDPLRVLRVMQFASRFGFKIDPQTIEICQSLDITELPRERIFGEFNKWLLKSEYPSIGLALFEPLNILSLFPELKELSHNDVLQEGLSGDLLFQTGRILDAAAHLKHDFSEEDQRIYMLAALCIDLGRTRTDTQVTQKAVETAVQSFLGRLTNETLLFKAVLPLVIHQDIPLKLYEAKAHDREIRRLACHVGIKMLIALAKAKYVASHPFDSMYLAGQWLWERAQNLGVDRLPPQPILQGRHLISELQLKPGPIFGEILSAVFERQLDGEIHDLKEALEAARKYVQGLR